MSNSDYKKNRLNINELLPVHISKTEISRSIQENLFNRFLSQDEYNRIIGVIGTPDPRASVSNQVSESNEFKQQHQLQPVPHVKIGSVDHYLSFNDLLRRLKYLGVDIDRYDEWGNSMQFNWVPPIDIDKIINYQDYFWVADNFDDIPQYVTVQNRCTWTSSRYSKIKESLLNAQNTTAIEGVSGNTIAIVGNVQSKYSLGEYIILGSNNKKYDLVKITNISFNNSTLNTELTVNTTLDIPYIVLGKTKFDIISIIDSDRKLSIPGDLTSIFTEGYVFSLIDSVTTATSYHSVNNSTFIPETNSTEITINEDFIATDWSYISALPQLLSASEEYKSTCISNHTSPLFTEWADEFIGELLWSKNKLITRSFSTGETNLDDDNFYDDTALFVSNGVSIGDIVNIINGKGIGQHTIISTSETILGLHPNTFFFTDKFLDYQIIRPLDTESITSSTQPLTPEIHDLWIDKNSNTLKQWDGAAWNVVSNNIDVMINSTFGRHLLEINQKNDWSEQNNWVHKTQLTTFASATKAQLPIIEFSPFIKFSTTSYATKEWKYKDIIENDYKEVAVIPNLFELHDIRLIDGNEFSFMTTTKLLLHEKFGNLTDDINIGSRIVFSDFAVNTGSRIVSNVEYYKVFPYSRYQTVITFTSPVNDPFDLPTGAYIGPEFTSLGDPWLGVDAKQWRFEGIVNIEPSSIVTAPNPMLFELIETKTVPKDIQPDPNNPDLLIGNPIEYETNIGLVWQSFSFPNPVSATSLEFKLDERLHDLALYEDYQEGDIRVYINNIRQYGNYVDLPSPINPDFVGSIQFNEHTTITNEDTVRIELGEYALSEIGKRNVSVDTVYGTEKYNLVDLRLMEQIKSETNQYPYFSIFDINGTPKFFANNIFKFNESSDYPANPYMGRRIVADTNTRTFEFINELFDDATGELYCYYDASFVDNELQHIWKKGLNNEQYVPRKIENSNYWELPNQLYYNVQHKNSKVISFKDIFRHFKLIADAQNTPGVYSSVSNLFHLDDNINWGLGGTIKEHNDNYDLLISSMFLNNVNPIKLIQFAHDQYSNNFKWIEERFIDEFSEIINDPAQNNINSLSQFISEYLIDAFETNDRFDQWFGDSTTYNESSDTGIKNWIITTPYMGLSPLFKPYKIVDKNLNILELVHHDGHRKNISLSLALKDKLNKKLENLNICDEQIITNDNDAFPTEINGLPVNVGNFVIRKNLITKTKKVFRLNSVNVWEELLYEELLLNCFLDIETRLYNNAPVYDNLRYDFSITKSDSSYSNLLEKQFVKYGKNNSIEYLYANEIFFNGNDPYTWNYSYTDILLDPRTGVTSPPVGGAWQSVYEAIYNTPYPHLEPWRLQDYQSKPEWWDDVYTDPLTSRRWKIAMWNNIINGRVPVGEELPDASISNGLNGEVQTYLYVPVNIDNIPTPDGIPPDGLIPPYWNSSNAYSSEVRGLYDANLNEFIQSPDLDYEWGNNGREEWKWSTSLQRLYDELIVAFTIQPLKFLSQSYGIDFINVNCLKLDSSTKAPYAVRNTLFHGDVIDGTNDIVTINGLAQVYAHYNRYYNFDGQSSEFRSLWAEWNPSLSYEFSAFIDTPSFTISNSNFDITTRDYTLDIKHTRGIDQKSIFGLRSKILSIPSKYARDRNYGLGWTAEFYNLSPDNKDLIFYDKENYDYIIKDDLETFRISSYKIESADIQNERGLQVINYNQSAKLSDPTQYSNTQAQFYASILINGVTNINLVVVGANVQTMNELLLDLNTQLGANATATLEQGNIYIRSDMVGGTSSITITDAGLFATANENYSSIQPSTVEPLKFNKNFIVMGNYTSIFKDGSPIKIYDSTNFNGTYTVFGTFYDAPRNQTNILINEDVLILDDTVDGTIELVDAITLPDTWVTGTEVFLNGNTTPPTQLDNTIPYYLIRLNDREFKLSQTPDSNIPITGITSSSYTNLKIGRLERTFRALETSEDSPIWRRHYSDKRIIKSYPNLISITSIQNMVDFLTGYEDYLYDIGFDYKNIDGDNYDVITGRVNDWQFEIEKFIFNLFNLRSRRQEEVLEYQVEVDSGNNNFKIKNSGASWDTGTQVVLIEGDSDTILPQPFVSTFSNTIPYYLIRGMDDDIFQLAYSLHDAKNGRYIDIIDDGVGDIRVKIFKQLASAPELEINPIKNAVWVNNDIGVLNNVFSGNNLDVVTPQAIFDNNKNEMNVSDIIVFREDLQSKITLVNQLKEYNSDLTIPINRYMSGMNLFYDGYEHIIRFSDYSTQGSLIYNSFLGVNTLNFYVEFNRQVGETYRPNVGGFIVSDDNLVQNMESYTNDIRKLYDTYTNIESKNLITQGRKSIGFTNTLDYMNDLNINKKSQFLFWRGLIQNKGTNFAVNAFTNQKIFEGVEVDEFWAYKLADFGDVKERIYPEMILFPEDVVKHELRLEFILPEEGDTNSTFTTVKLTDGTRWWDQPDQIESLHPDESFWFNIKVIETIENAETILQSINGNIVLPFDFFVPDVIITVYDALNDKIVQLKEFVDFVFMSSKAIKFIGNNDPYSYTDMTVNIITYNYDFINPAKVIDKENKLNNDVYSDINSVITEVPVWNPAFGEYFYIPEHIVTIKGSIDHANYTNYPDNSPGDLSPWLEDKIGEVWFDDSLEYYMPYYDKTAVPNFDKRMSIWGKLAEWGDIALYEWVESDVPPNEWSGPGTPKQLLYKNMAADINNDPEMWELNIDNDIHEDYIAGLVTPLNTTSLTGDVEVYVNGVYYSLLTLIDFDDFTDFASGLPQESHIHLIKRGVSPTDDEFNSRLYKYDTPYSTRELYDVYSAKTKNVYYFWVRNTANKIKFQNGAISLVEAERSYKNMSHPYMIIDGLRDSEFGYGLIYGSTFDPFDYIVPNRYTKVIIKGLRGVVRGEGRYTLRFTRDLSLRDTLGDSLSLKNIHTEWKLFREKQLYKISQRLWERIIESIIGKKVVDNIVYHDTQLPKLERILYDTLYDKDTRYGLGNEQVFTDRNLALTTITSILNNSNREFFGVDIDDFRSTYTLDTETNIVKTMYEIYNSFSIKDVNYIFFEILKDALSLKKNHRDIFKTSWVALQISQNVSIPKNIPLNVVNLEAGGECNLYTDEINGNPTTPLPSPSVTPTMTPTPSVTPTLTPTLTVTPTMTNTPEVTPTITNTPTLSVTPSL